MKKFAKICSRIVEKYLPDAFLFAVILTVITYVGALVFTDATPVSALFAWGDGIWNLLAFTAQMATIMVFGYAFAKTPFMEKVLAALCNRVNTPKQAYFVTSAAAGVFSWICWPAGLICGAFIATELGKKIKNLHFPLLVAAAYSGFLLFQMGFTGTHLILNTSGTWSEALVGLVPSSQTFLTPWNIFLSVSLGIVIVPWMMTRMEPSKAEIIELDPENLPEPAPQAEKVVLKGLPFNAWVENNYFFNLLLGIPMALYIVLYFMNGGELTINSTNLIFLCLGILLTPTPIQFVKRCVEGAGTAGGVIMQFPLYAGIQGIMLGTGLAGVIAGWFISISTVRTLPLTSFISAGIINMFIPSGGSQWAVQGPIMLEAAIEMGADIPRVAMASIYGDGWTNMIQPFWALPILAIANLKAKDIMGYLVAVLLVAGLLIGAVLVFWP